MYIALSIAEILAHTPEHPVPAAGQVAHDVFEPIPGWPGVVVNAEASGWATLTISAAADSTYPVQKSARDALVRAKGGDPTKPDDVAKVRRLMGTMGFAQQVNILVQQHFLAMALMRTGIRPFMAPEFLSADGPIMDQDFNFQVRLRLRPVSELSDYGPVTCELPQPEAVTEAAVTERVGQMAGIQADWNVRADLDQEARASFAKLQGMVRGQLEAEAAKANQERVMGAVADALATRLVSQAPAGYMELLRDQMANQYAAGIEAGGARWEEFIASPMFSMDAFKEQMTEQAQTALRRGLALDAYAVHEGITLTESDLLTMAQQIAGGDGAYTLEMMRESGQLPHLCEVALRAKANEAVLEASKQA